MRGNSAAPEMESVKERGNRIDHCVNGAISVAPRTLARGDEEASRGYGRLVRLH